MYCAPTTHETPRSVCTSGGLSGPDERVSRMTTRTASAHKSTPLTASTMRTGVVNTVAVYEKTGPPVRCGQSKLLGRGSTAMATEAKALFGVEAVGATSRADTGDSVVVK